jgi:cellulose synthase/poly-beta-1,6-N-acetylglucosamine synthase-like glycosyltransferase
LARKSDAGPSTTRFCCLARHTEHDHAFILVALPAAFRIWVVTHPTPSALEPSPDTQHEQESLYSIIAPLRGEARVVDQLLSAIERLNYPPEKLDVIIAVEAKDDATRAAITARKHRIPITVIPVPAVGPATKPKALNVALPFARGTFTRTGRSETSCAQP